MTASGNSSPPAALSARARAGATFLRGPALAAAATAAVVLVATAAASLLVRAHLLDEAESTFEVRTVRTSAEIRRELVLCTQILRGAGGFVAAQPTAPGDLSSADAWDRYIARQALDDTPPSVRSLGYAALTANLADVPASSGANAGTGTGAAVPLAHIMLTWPQHSETLDGQDLGVRAETRAALLRAADTAQIATAVRQESHEADAGESATRARVDLYLPVYRNTPPPALPPARRAALAGFVFARLDTDYLFASVAARAPRMELHVTGGTPSVVLYPPGGTSNEGTEQSRFHRTETLRFGGETFSLTYATSDPSLTAAADFGSSATLAAGCVAALIASGAAFAFARRRGTPLTEAGLARSLSTLNEARMMTIIRSSSEAIITIDDAQRIVIFNPMAERIFRCSAMDAIGQPLDRFIPERYRQAHSKHVEQFGATGVSERKMGGQRVLAGLRADGEEFPVEASISQTPDGDGTRKFYTVMLRDVTERMKADDDLKKSREALRKLSANLQNVREEEKTRIARELHDDLGQQLTALKIDLSSIELSLGANESASPDVLAQLRGMRRIIDTTVASARRIAADLRPVMLDDLGLLPAIDWLVNDFRTRYGIEVERRIEPGDVMFSRNAATALFRIAQEALTNVARHADATRVTLTLVVEGAQCKLSIADNGRGAAEPGALDAHGEKSFGLLGIRERAHILGGSVSIETAVKHGFAITVVFPLAAIQQEEALP
ncbi:PAS domain S-box protein [Trinickia fusca]|uniref:histidine kinase n=1 Tax=Trinickia fusca TaxID=2419777 RepID=A0A494X5L7_9BURK|nr:PAS domain S-box protein [Trinickia fusca]RKP45978.1 PAS domain S-box protein [Trinickia fusca]